MEMPVTRLEVHKVEPEGFTPHVQIACCYLEIDNGLLLLQQAHGKLDPGKWGMPAGKLEKGETPDQAARRELFEETGISLHSPSQIQGLGALYIRKPSMDYVFHMFRVNVDQRPEIHISAEHQGYAWATSKDLEEMPLMTGAAEVLQHYRASLIR
jgi:8-oxo-dGTP diphosphatase